MTIPRRKPYFPSKIISKLVRFGLTKNKELIIQKLEKNLTSKLKIPNPVLVESGRIGLYLILKCSGLNKGSEIIIPGLTFGTVKSVIKLSGFKPIPVDSDPETFQMSPTSVQKAITPNTSAILATHMFGNLCDIILLKQIAAKHGLLLIEDCAESLGATFNGKQTGTFGNIAFSSFNIAKPLQGIGGGVVFGNDRVIISKIRSMLKANQKSSSVSAREVVRSLGGYFLSQTILWPALMYCFSFPKIQRLFVLFYRKGENVKMGIRGIPYYYAFIVNESLQTFQKRLAKAQGIIDSYKRQLSTSLQFQTQLVGSKSNGYMTAAFYPGDVMKLRRNLAKKGIDIALRGEVADDCLNKPGSVTSKLFNHLISLPIYYGLANKQLRKVCQNLK